MNTKLFALGTKLANGNDTVVQATKLVARGTKDGVLSFITGYKAQREINKVANERGLPYFAR